MNANKERIAFLLEAYTSNRISEEELKELAELTSKPASDFIVSELLQDYWNRMPVDHEQLIPKDDIYNRILSDNRFKQPTPQSHKTKVSRLYSILPYAAAVLLLLAAGIIYGVHPFTSQETATLNNPVSKVIQPGSKKAILTLADGSQIALDHHLVGKVAGQGNLTLQQNKGQLIYQSAGNTDLAAANAQNVVTTPKGGEYQLILHDGTRVWLNAASSLSYPVVFSGAERRVKIQGEAYFEVAKNAKMPFIVEGNGTAVKVLGTHFNVSAYPDDAFVKTTLVEGAVEVSRKLQKALLKPGQEAFAGVGADRINVKNVDTEQALAWKNGYFMFDNEDIKTVMKLISRWYNVDVEYQGNLTGKTFGGTISRFGEIRDLLKSIELTDAIHFEIRGRRVIVKP